MRGIKCCWHELLGWWKNPKTIASFLIVFLFVFHLLKTTRSFAKMVGIGVTPWVFPYLFTDPISLFLIELVILFVLSDVPNYDQSQTFVLLRVGKLPWMLGQLLYLAVASLIFCFAIYAFSVLCMAPYVEFSAGWGKVIGTLAQTNAAVQYGTMGYPYEIMKDYSPIHATAISFFLFWLSDVLLGEVLMLLNLFVHRGIAVTVASALILLPYLIYFSSAYNLLKFSPMSWCNLMYINQAGSNYPSLQYAFTVLLVGIVILAIVILCCTHKRTFALQEEVQ